METTNIEAQKQELERNEIPVKINPSNTNSGFTVTIGDAEYEVGSASEVGELLLNLAATADKSETEARSDDSRDTAQESRRQLTDINQGNILGNPTPSVVVEATAASSISSSALMNTYKLIQKTVIPVSMVIAGFALGGIGLALAGAGTTLTAMVLAREFNL